MKNDTSDNPTTNLPNNMQVVETNVFNIEMQGCDPTDSASYFNQSDSVDLTDQWYDLDESANITYSESETFTMFQTNSGSYRFMGKPYICKAYSFYFYEDSSYSTPKTTDWKSIVPITNSNSSILSFSINLSVPGKTTIYVQAENSYPLS